MKAENKKISGGKIIKKVFAGFVFLGIFLLFSAADSSADVQEDIPHIAGVVEGTGTHFEITDSKYINITLESDKNITGKIESMPEMVTLEIEARTDDPITNLTFSGFTANTVFHKYEDDYHNYTPITTGENGAFSFETNLSQPKVIFIQPKKSTKFIKNNATGGDCVNIGSWNTASKTCTLSQDVFETIQIDDDNITLDGAGYFLLGNSWSNGIYATKKYFTLKNMTITGSNYGIYLRNAQYGKIDSVVVRDAKNGIVLMYAKNNILSNNMVESTVNRAISLEFSQSNALSGNTIKEANNYAIYQGPSHSDYNVYEKNNISDNCAVGMRIYFGDYITVKDNIVKSNCFSGIDVSGNYLNISGNVMSGNGSASSDEDNFSITNVGAATNIVDKSNTIEGKPIFYLKNEADKVYDDSFNIGSFYCVNCNNITLKNIQFPENGSFVGFWNTDNSLVENVSAPDRNTKFFLSEASDNIIKNNYIYRLSIANSSNNNEIYNNNFLRTDVVPVNISNSTDNLFNLDLPTGGNYWKRNEKYCKDLNGDGICDGPFVFSVGIDHFPIAKEIIFKPPCCSSVMFLPGHQGSRLYKKDSSGEDQLWEPTNHNEDVRELFLDSNGESVDPGIYTRDIIDEGYGVKNIYENFIASMNQFTADDVIKEWKPIPYDWRLPLEKIAENGVKLENGGHIDIIEEIERMAAESKTGKVTFVGHSNGGLLAKVLIERLKDAGEENLVDKLIMVGTPQLGTPKAAVGLLHGDEINLLYGLILDKKTARGFAENMASAYNLLPSSEYFNDVQSPIVEFDEDVKNIYDFRSLYGENIDNRDEFKKFLLGDDGARSEPEASDLDSPNVLDETLLAKAQAAHDSLDDWQAPEGMEVVQIAGWGLDTIRGVKYDDCDIPFCPDKLSNLDRSLIMTQDGDETVVVPSAVEMVNDAEDYYIDLKLYNSFGRFQVNRGHSNILEIESLQNFIKNIIQNNKTLTEYITVEKPEVKDEDKRLRFRLHSPVKIDLYDEKGNHTGPVENPNPSSDLELYEEQISNSYYIESGEKKYAGSGDLPVDIILTGEDLGIFTFEIDQVTGDKVAKNTTFANIPTMKDMRAELAVSETVSEMKIDVDWDGQIDATIQAGEEVKKEEMLGIFQKIIASLDIDRTVKDRLANKIENAQKQMEKGHSISANAMLENVKQQIETLSREQTPEKFRIPKEEAEKLIKIIERILAVE